MKEKVTLTFNGFPAFVQFLRAPKSLRLDQIDVKKNGENEGLTIGDLMQALNDKAQEVHVVNNVVGNTGFRVSHKKGRGKKKVHPSLRGSGVVLNVRKFITSQAPSAEPVTASAVAAYVAQKLGIPESGHLQNVVSSYLSNEAKNANLNIWKVKRGLYVFSQETLREVRRSLGQKRRHASKKKATSKK